MPNDTKPASLWRWNIGVATVQPIRAVASLAISGGFANLVQTVVQDRRSGAHPSPQLQALRTPTTDALVVR